MSGANLATYKVYLMNVVLMGVLVIIVVISIYWLACRTNKHRRVQVNQLNQINSNMILIRISSLLVIFIFTFSDSKYFQLRYSNNVYHQAGINILK